MTMDDELHLADRRLLQELADREQIREVLYRMSRAIDRHDMDLRASVWHPDATDNHGIFDGSVADYTAWLVSDQSPASKFDHTQHMLGNILIELDGDVADTESYLLATHVMHDDAGEYFDIMGCRYFDRLERRNGEWRIAVRQVLVDWRTAARADETCPPFPGFEHFLRGQRGPGDFSRQAGFYPSPGQ